MYGIIGKILSKMGYSKAQIAKCDINGDGDITFGEIKKVLGTDVATKVRNSLPDRYFADPVNRRFPIQNAAQARIAKTMMNWPGVHASAGVKAKIMAALK